MSPDATQLERALSYSFVDRKLLQQALTHRSKAHETGGEHNERLEFLGDAVLGLATVGWLIRRFPDSSEGELSLLKHRLVSADSLATWARSLEIGTILRLGKSEDRSGGRTKASLLGDCLEALLGAIYLDSGFEAAQEVISRWLERLDVDPAAESTFGSAKNHLQEWVQGRGSSLPVYRLVSETGPPHERFFEVEVVLEGRAVGRGSGRRKKIAEQHAAVSALRTLNVRSE